MGIQCRQAGTNPRTLLLAPLPPQLQQLQVKMHLWFLPQVQKLLNQPALLPKLLLPLQCLKVQATLWEVVLLLREEQQGKLKMILRRLGGEGLHSLIKWPKTERERARTVIENLAALSLQGFFAIM